MRKRQTKNSKFPKPFLKLIATILVTSISCYTPFTYDIGVPDCSPHNVRNIFGSRETVIVGCIGTLTSIVLVLDPTL